jgi:hypothetical protein
MQDELVCRHALVEHNVLLYSWGWGRFVFPETRYVNLAICAVMLVTHLHPVSYHLDWNGGPENLDEVVSSNVDSVEI